MSRKISKKGIKKKLDKLVADMVKERDNHLCQWCGKFVVGSNEHASHVIPKSKGNYLRWDLQNLKVLCFNCHINNWHKNPVLAGKWFRKTFPNRWRYLEPRMNKLVKYTISDLEELYEKLK